MHLLQNETDEPKTGKPTKKSKETKEKTKEAKEKPKKKPVSNYTKLIVELSILLFASSNWQGLCLCKEHSAAHIKTDLKKNFVSGSVLLMNV